MLEELKKRHGKADLYNLKTIQSAEYDFGIAPGTVTFTFLCNVLHEIDDKSGFIKNIFDILKAGGRLALIDWQKIDSNMGPPIDHRIDRNDTAAFLEESGFKDMIAEDLNEHLYSVIGFKN